MKNWFKKITLQNLFFIFLFLFIAFFNSLNLNINYFYTSDDIKNYQIVTSLERGKNSIEISGKGNDIFKNFENITFLPAIENIDDKIYNNSTVETSRDGFPELNYYLWTIGKIYFGDYFLYIINLFLTFFLFIFIYKVFGNNFTLAIIISSFSIILFWSNFLMSNIIGLFYFSVFLYLFFKHSKKLLLILLIIISTLLVRYEYVILFLIIIFGQLFFFSIKNFSIKKTLLLYMGLFILILSLIYLTFYLDFKYDTKFTNRLTEHINYFFQLRNFKDLLLNINQYIIGIIPIAFLGLIGLAKNYKHNKILFISVIIFGFFFLKNADYWGFNANWLASSYVRYMLPIYVILIFGLIYFFENKNKVKIVFLGTLLFIFGINLILNSKFGIFHIKNLSNHEKNAINNILSNYGNGNNLLIDGTGYYSNFTFNIDRIKINNINSNKHIDYIDEIINIANNYYEDIFIIESDNRGNRENFKILNFSTYNTELIPINIVYGVKPLVYKIKNRNNENPSN